MPAPVVTEDGALVTRRWRVDRSPAVPEEPGAAPIQEYLPNVRIGWGISLDDTLGRMVDAVSDENADLAYDFALANRAAVENLLDSSGGKAEFIASLGAHSHDPAMVGKLEALLKTVPDEEKRPIEAKIAALRQKLASDPRMASQTWRQRMPNSTAQPASGAAISSPVANSTPSWRRWPPINCSSAPGMAHSIIDIAAGPVMPLLIVAA